MRASAAVLVFIVSVTLLATPAGAQDARRLGLTMGYPSGFGFIWHASDDVAIRPELSFSRSSSSTETEGFGLQVDRSSTSWQVGAGASVLLYLTDADGLRTYVAPRFTYTRADGGETVSTSRQLAGLFGAQYAVGPRFIVFGETGLSYARRRFSSDSSLALRTELRGSSVGLTSGAGVAFYF